MGRKVYSEVYVDGTLYRPGQEMDDAVAEKVRNKRIFSEQETVIPKASQGGRVQGVASGDEPKAKPGWSASPRVPKSAVADVGTQPEKKGPSSAHAAEHSDQGARSGAADAGKRASR